MNTYNNDMDILVLNAFLIFITSILWYFGKRTCLLKYIIYGIVFLPLTYFLVSLMGLALFFPKEISYLFLIFGIFYIPYLVALVPPSIMIEKLDITLFIVTNFSGYSKLIEFFSYIVFWVILFSILGYILCKNINKRR